MNISNQKTNPSPVPKVITVHDLTGVGRCALTVVIPVLCHMGVQPCPLPTALLSTHPAGFHHFIFEDTTSVMEKMMHHWQQEQLHFDGIYSGFLGWLGQMMLMEELLTAFGQGALIVVDPVMGDHGVMYRTVSEDMRKKMQQLIKKAQVITPNMTEICLLCDMPYEKEMPLPRLKEAVKHLADQSAPQIVVTGVPLGGDKICNLSYNKDTDTFFQCERPLVPAQYPGTGDIFAAVLTGAMLQGKSFFQAVDEAADFVYTVVDYTYKAQTPPREGVLLEAILKRRD